MKKRILRARSRIALAAFAAASLSGFARETRATAYNWASNISGNFNNNALWSPSTGSPSTASDTATFQVAASSTYTVTFTGSPTISAVTVGTNNAVTFVTDGTARTFTALQLTVQNAGSSLTLGGVAVIAPLQFNPGQIAVSSSGNLNIVSGYDVSTSLFLETVGTATTSVNGAGSTLTVNGTSNLGSTNATGSLTYVNGANGILGNLNIAATAGTNEIGFFTVLSGAGVTSTGNILVGTGGSSGEAGTLKVSDPTSTFVQSGTTAITVGSAVGGTGTLSLFNSGALTTGTGLLTASAGGLVDITGGTLNANGNITVNGGTIQRDTAGVFNWASGKTMTLQNNGHVTITGSYALPTSATVALNTGTTFSQTGSGALTVGSGSQVNAVSNAQLNAVTLNVGTSGNGTVTASGASQVPAGSMFIGGNGSTGSLTLSSVSTGGFGSSLNIATLGSGSNGTVSVQSGATLSGNNVIVGSTNNAGTLTVTGSGSNVSQIGAGTLYVGGTTGSSGTLNVQASGVYTTGGQLTTVAAGGLINVDGGTFSLNGNMLLDGGTFQQTSTSGSTFTWTPVASITVQNGGHASFSGSMTLANAKNVQVTGSGSTLNVSAGSLNIVGASLVNVGTGGHVTADAINLGSNVGGVGTLQAAGLGAQVNAGAAALTNVWGTNSAQAFVTFDLGSSGSFAGTIALGNDATALAGSSVLVQNAATLTASSLQMGTSGISTTTTVTGLNSAINLNAAGTALSLGGVAPGGGTSTMNVTAGGTLNVTNGSTTINQTGVVNITDGYAYLGNLTIAGGTLNFNSGLLGFANTFEIGTGGILGSNVTLDSTHFVTTTGATIIDAFHTLTINGATLSTSTLAINGTLAFNSGTIALTGAGGLTIGSGGPFSTSLNLPSGKNVSVTNALIVNSGSSLTVGGGNFSAGSVNNSGTISLTTAGAFAVSGAITNQAAGRLFVGPDASFDTAGAIANVGRIQMQGGAARLGGAGAITNTGLITGDGEIAKPVTNASGGEIRAEDGKTIFISGTIGTSSGKINLQSGTAEFGQALTIDTTGVVTGHGTLMATGGITNNGQMQFSAGTTDIYGAVTSTSGSKFTTTGGSTTTFFSPVTMQTGSTFQVSQASTAVFFGDVHGDNVSIFTGTGTKDFEGGQFATGPIITLGSTIVQQGVSGTATAFQENALTVNGNVTIPQNGTSSGTSKVGALSVGGVGKLDLTNNKLIVTSASVGSWNGSNYDGISGLVKSGRNGGAWNGSGIVTSQTAAASPSLLTTLAVAKAGDVGKTSFGGQSVSPTDVLVMYTYAGDANLDGKVNADDYFQIDSHLNSSTNGGKSFLNGDFNYDGKIDGDDYALIDASFVGQGAAISGGPVMGDSLGGVNAVPEPTVIGLLGLTFGGLARRRSRRI